MKGFTGFCILMLGMCVILTALPELRDMVRKDEFFAGCLEYQIPDRYPEYQRIVMCENMWNRRGS